MRKILPAISPCPPATCIPCSRKIIRTSCLPSIPSGTQAAVTAELRSSSGPKSSRPMPLIPALEARLVGPERTCPEAGDRIDDGDDARGGPREALYVVDCAGRGLREHADGGFDLGVVSQRLGDL